MGFVLTANRLSDGGVVYRDAQGGWAERLEGAALYDGKPHAEAALEAAAEDVAARVIVAPYLFEAEPGAHGPAPVKARERIRAAGPTVRRDLGKQASG